MVEIRPPPSLPPLDVLLDAWQEAFSRRLKVSFLVGKIHSWRLCRKRGLRPVSQSPGPIFVKSRLRLHIGAGGLAPSPTVSGDPSGVGTGGRADQ